MNRLFGLKSLVTQVLYPHNAPKIGTIWKHYQGDLFVVSGIATDRTTKKLQVCYYTERELLLYVWVMSLDRWHQKIGHNGKIVPRFSEVVPQK